MLPFKLFSFSALLAETSYKLLGFHGCAPLLLCAVPCGEEGVRLDCGVLPVSDLLYLAGKRPNSMNLSVHLWL